MNIIFDFGGVLIDWNQRYFYRDYFKNDEEMEYFLAHICTPEWNSQMDEGKTFEQAIKELQLLHPEYKEAIGLYRVKWTEMFKGAINETVEYLKELKNRGYRLLGLTNWSAETIDIARELFPFLNLFEGVVVSGEEKVLKPNPKIYKILLERYGLKAEECVFIDDNEANILGARALGIHGIHFKNATRLREELEALLK